MYDVAFDLSQTISTQNPKKIFSKNLEMSKYLLFMSLVDPFEKSIGNHQNLVICFLKYFACTICHCEFLM